MTQGWVQKADKPKKEQEQLQAQVDGFELRITEIEKGLELLAIDYQQYKIASSESINSIIEFLTKQKEKRDADIVK